MDNKFRVFLRDRVNADNEMPLLAEINLYNDFEAIVRFNTVGSWKMQITSGTDQAKLIGDGQGKGIAVFPGDSQTPLFSGPIHRVERRWDKTNSGPGSLDISGPDDNVIIRSRLAWPNPQQDIHLSSKRVYWPPSYLGKPPANLGEFFNAVLWENLAGGEGVNGSKRSIPGLYMPKTFDPLLPDTNDWKVYKFRYDSIEADLLALMTINNVRVDFRWMPSYQDGDTTVYNKIVATLTPTDTKVEQVVFGPQFGNLRGYHYTSSAPKTTRLIMGAKGEGKNRYFAERRDTSFDPEDWPVDAPLTKIETDWGFSSEGYKDLSDLEWNWQQAKGKPAGWAKDPDGADGGAMLRKIEMEAAEFLSANGPQASISLDAVNIPGCVFGADYDVGDNVRALIDGTAQVERVREVKLSSSPSELFKIQPTIGTYDASETPFLYRQIQGLWGGINDVAGRDEFAEMVPSIVQVQWRALREGGQHGAWITAVGKVESRPGYIRADYDGITRPTDYWWDRVDLRVIGRAPYNSLVRVEKRKSLDEDWSVYKEEANWWVSPASGSMPPGVWVADYQITDARNTTFELRAKTIIDRTEGIESAYSNLFDISFGGGTGSGGTLVVPPIDPKLVVWNPPNGANPSPVYNYGTRVRITGKGALPHPDYGPYRVNGQANWGWTPPLGFSIDADDADVDASGNWALSLVMKGHYNAIKPGQTKNATLEISQYQPIDTPWNVDVTYGKNLIYRFKIKR